MPVLFISHSSRDDRLVDALGAWLPEIGVTDVFIDHQNITGGTDWADALRASAGACRVVICLVTENWLASPECFGEFTSAWFMGKRILPLFLVEDPGALTGEPAKRWGRVRAQDQGVDLRPLHAADGLDFTADETLVARLRDALRAAGAVSKPGLDPEAFEIDQARRPSPFPGLASFEDEDADAALFYGRSREIAAVLDDLRRMRANGDLRPLMILGASGAGKSSLLKAGVIPRLRREAPAWIPLRAFRPGADPLFNFAEAIARTLDDFNVKEASGVLRRELAAAWQAAAGADRTEAERWATLAAALDGVAARLRKAADRPEATLLISIDQAEELARAEGESGEALADYLRATLTDAAQADWRLAFTIRTDSFPELQRHPRFRDLDSYGYDLRALPVFRFDDVVQQPAARYGVEIDPDLVDALMEDAPKSDALPLLAFAMQRLWRRFAEAGAIRLQDYRDQGGMAGMIEDAAERALRGLSPEEDKPLPKGPPPARVLTLGAKTFVPPLAQINDEGEAIRRVAPWAEFSEEARALLENFDAWRLVVRKGQGADGVDGDTVEVAHEALFREWSRLRDWLEPERERLDALRGAQVAAKLWAREERSPADLTHFGPRLVQAQELMRLERYVARLGEVDRAYLAACGAAERTSRRRRLLLQTAAGVFGLGVMLSGFGFAFQDELTQEWTRWRYFKPLTAAQFEALKPGETFRECAAGMACPEMVVLPRGRFRMGSEKGSRNERPFREVAIEHPLAVGKFEVTHAEWEACVAASPAIVTDFGCTPVSDSTFGRGDRPVINVTWNDAQGYVAWLNKMTTGDVAGPYRLLSEAEWEYAARAGSTTRYHFDDYILLGDYAWYSYNSNGETHPVGGKKPNRFGLHDVHGNVWEWVQDCWNDSYRGAPTNGSAWKSGDCSLAVLRGGSYNGFPRYLRSASRNRYGRGVRYRYVGFRVARVSRTLR